MSITLPPLPEPSNYPSAIEMLRARDIEVANMVLEAAAKVCGDIASRANIAWCLSGQEHDFVQSCELQKLAESIRALRIEGETPAMHGFNDERSAL